MAVAILIGLWIWDELSFNFYHQNHDRIAQVYQSQTADGIINTEAGIPAGLGAELRNVHGSDFKYIAMSSWTGKHILSAGANKILTRGNFMEADAPKLFSFNILKGTGNGLNDPSAILLSNTLATALFGSQNPVGETVVLDNGNSFKVTGVYEELPANTTFHQRDITFIGSWNYYAANVLPKWVFNAWAWDCAQLFVQVADNADIAKVSQKIKNTIISKEASGEPKCETVLNPMDKWHLYEYKNGVQVWGQMQYVWLFGIIGIFVLLLACINFMNLSTARSEKRAKEVGIRKAIGSARSQLIKQFFCESLLTAMLAFAVALILVQLIMPWFNNVTNKQIAVSWLNPFFWTAGLGFAFFTGLVAGSYPALYLSSFRPVKVLKGTFKAGSFAAIQRKLLAVVQFTVSIVLIIGTITVFKQVKYAESRPVGYNRDGLINITLINNDLNKQFDAVRNDLLQSGFVSEAAESSDAVTGIGNNVGSFQWKGKPPGMNDDFGFVGVTFEYGKAVGWQFKEGRDFSRQHKTDSAAVVLNEAAVKYMGLKNPVGETVRLGNRDYRVIGVTTDMVMNSPFAPATQTIFYINNEIGRYLLIKVNPNVSMRRALNKIEKVCKTYSPAMPFSYSFVDEEYAKKFASEERIGTLARFFAALAIFISCLGLFGMASFMAEQRVKEIGVRKVLGASVFGLWRLLSKDFVTMVVISQFVAMPVAWWIMHNWLQNYTYRTGLSWWVFAVSGFGALVITLLTISYQSIKAAIANPVKSLRSE